MLNNNNDEMISRALQSVLATDIAEYEKIPDHKFSHRFNTKMKKLIYCQPLPTMESSSKYVPLRKRVTAVILAVILMLLLMGAALTAYKLWDYYKMDDYSLYTVFNISDSLGDYPTELKERYALCVDLSDFNENVLLDEYFNYWVEYENNDGTIKIGFEQRTKESIQNIHLNTEDAIVMPMEVEVNGCRGIFFETKYESMILFWDVGDYIISLDGKGISKDELFSLAKFVQKVE